MVWFEDNQILSEAQKIRQLTPVALRDVTEQPLAVAPVSAPAAATARAAQTPQPITLNLDGAERR